MGSWSREELEVGLKGAWDEPEEALGSAGSRSHSIASILAQGEKEGFRAHTQDALSHQLLGIRRSRCGRRMEAHAVESASDQTHSSQTARPLGPEK